MNCIPIHICIRVCSSISSTIEVTDLNLKDYDESTSANSSNNFSIINSSSFSLISSSSSSIMPTKSILDRYRTNTNRINISEYLRYPCSANTLWKKLPSQARVKFEKTMKYEFTLISHSIYYITTIVIRKYVHQVYYY